MTLIHYILFSFFILTTLIHQLVIFLNNKLYVYNFILGRTTITIYNYEFKRLGFISSIFLFIIPFSYFEFILSLNIESNLINYILIALAIVMNLFFTYFNKLIFSNKFEENLNKQKTIESKNKAQNNSTLEPKTFEYFKDAVINTSLYNEKIKCFNINGFKDENTIKEKTTKVTEIRSIQYLFVFYIIEYLGENLNSELHNKQYEIFNNVFTPRYRHEISKLTSSNWSDFEKYYLINYRKSEFYLQLSKELKIKLNLKAE